jgi:DNA-binding phage protein
MGSEIREKADNSGLLERLREAVERGGGPSKVARSSGVPLSTLNDYLAGTDIRLSRGARIAAACGVSLDWLVSGQEIVSSTQDALNKRELNQKDEILPADLLEFPINFYILETCLRSCRYFYSVIGETPTLRDALRWVANPYRQGLSLPDRPFTDPATDNNSNGDV